MAKKFIFSAAAFFLPLVVFAQGTVTLTNPANAPSICGFLKLLLQGLLILGIPVAVVFLVYAGFKFVWSRGNSTKLGDAKRNLFYTIIGIGIFVGAWLLGQVVANTLNSLATGAGQPNPQIGQCQ